MSVKDDVLRVLLENEGQSISGSNLARQLGVSRNAVWKAVCCLKDEGYTVDSASSKGYTLRNSGSVLKEELLRKLISDDECVSGLVVFDEIDSTNNAAKKLALSGAPDCTLVAAARQTAGRGRLGRSFLSEKNGIYFSYIIRPSCSMDKSLKITAGAAVAVMRVLKKYCSGVEIKWVNDVYINKKKVCGILTEAVSDFESGRVDYIVIGIGINLFGSHKDFGEDLENIVTTVEENISDKNALRPDKNVILSEVVRELYKVYKSLDNFDEIIDEYRSNSLVIGKDVFLLEGKVKTPVTVVGIDSEGALIVRDKDLNTRRISSGEVSVRF